MLFSGVRNSWLMLARNSDLYFEVSASSVAFSSTARRACSISWFFASTSTLRSASCCAFCSSCSLVCCSSRCWVCSSRASCWDCFSSPSVCIVASMEFSTMPMPVGQLLQEGHLKVREGADRGQFDHRLDLAFEQDRQHDDVARRGLEECRADRHHIVGHVGDQQPARVAGALADQAVADLQSFGIAGRWIIGIGGKELQVGCPSFCST